MNTTPEDAFKMAVLGTVPEKKDEFELLWSQNEININLSKDYQGFKLQSGAYNSIIYSHKTMVTCWVVGACAQISFDAWHQIILRCQKDSIKLSLIDLFSDSISKDLSSGARLVKRLLDADNFDDVTWYPKIPHPDLGKPIDVSGQMFFDVSCMSMAFNILHEINHISISNNGENLTGYEEEFACDAFAKRFLLEDIIKYSSLSGDDYNTVRSKRLMAIALSCSLFYMITQPKHWLESKSHPSISERVRALFCAVDISDNDLSCCYLSTSLLMVLLIFNVEVDELKCTTLKSLSFELLDILDDFARNKK
ncbi:phage exclusion protein Lit family protein [Morganella morganii]|uniref:phage exclusion protein Lit family protein n=1 Tax=Morganella morganii TaxID=582 RepID=UPI0004681426|nr:phage exclusion protein Lit family protein [Morganella morganii]